MDYVIVKRQMGDVIIDLYTLITERGIVVSNIRGLLSQIRKVTSHYFRGVFVNRSRKVSPLSKMHVRETVLQRLKRTSHQKDLQEHL